MKLKHTLLLLTITFCALFSSFAEEAEFIRYKSDNAFFSDFVHRVYTTTDGLP